MLFEKQLTPNLKTVAEMLGYYQTEPDAATAEAMKQAAEQLQAAAKPRWVFARFPLDLNGNLAATGVALQGQDIRRHLEGCTACILLGLTLGPVAEREIRAAEATDMQRAVLLDTTASVLIEQYADEAENGMREQLRQNGEYLTGRFSPGYGDFPLSVQPQLVRLMDGPRAIGLTVSESGILLPRKSITALLGCASHPVSGHLAGCENCALNGNCTRQKEGNYCAKPVV